MRQYLYRLMSVCHFYEFEFLSLWVWNFVSSSLNHRFFGRMSLRVCLLGFESLLIWVPSVLFSRLMTLNSNIILNNIIFFLSTVLQQALIRLTSEIRNTSFLFLVTPLAFKNGEGKKRFHWPWLVPSIYLSLFEKTHDRDMIEFTYKKDFLKTNLNVANNNSLWWKNNKLSSL